MGIHVRLALLMVLGCAHSAFAQTDFSGEWTRIQEEDSTLNPDIGDWFGIPMNAAAHARAETWDPSSWTLPEWQCRPHGGAYFKREPAALQITKEMDPVTRNITAYHAEWLRQVRIPIYLDGRPHPVPERGAQLAGVFDRRMVGGRAEDHDHPPQGKLSATQRHSGERQGELTEYWIRNGDYLTWIIITDDPVYLTEPLVWSSNYRLNLQQQVPPYPCSSVTEIVRAEGVVPHFLPGTNNPVEAVHRQARLPPDAIFGGAATMYPGVQGHARGRTP